MTSLSPAQIRAARAILDWSLDDLATASEISRPTLARVESGAANPHDDTMRAIRRAFESRDLQFLTDDGVKRNIGTMDRLTGRDALYRFFDDVYDTVKDGGDLCVSGVNEKLFASFNVSAEAADAHRARMSAIKDKIKFRVLLCEGDYYFRNDSYIQYRWMERAFFYENPIYLYNNKVAFIKFDNDNLEIVRIAMPSMAAAFRAQFDFIWNHSKTPPKKKDSA